MARWVIVSACSISADMLRYLQKGDVVVACDAGYRNLEALGITPDYVVGDFDSAPRPRAGKVVVLPHVKDDTDTQYAAMLAKKQGAGSVLMLGAIGGKRFEHSVANLCTALWLEKNGVPVKIVTEESEMEFVLPGTCKRFEKGEFSYFSVFPWEGSAAGVTLRGGFYPLQMASLRADYPLGVSNEFVEQQIALSVQQGSLLVIQTREDNRQ